VVKNSELLLAAKRYGQVYGNRTKRKPTDKCTTKGQLRQVLKIFFEIENKSGDQNPLEKTGRPTLPNW
jgi:hypothetical protein